MSIPINYFAVIIAAVLAMIIGATWYSPLLFAKPWMKLIGMTAKDMKNVSPARMYGPMFVGMLLAAYVMTHFVYYMKSDSVMAGVALGFWGWLGFAATSMLPTVIFENKPWKLYCINTGYMFVVFVVMGAVLSVWK